MLSLSQIEADLTQAMKAKDQALVETLRGLKTRIQNEQIAKMKALDEAAILALVKSEVKRRKESAEAFAAGGRTELAQKELQEVGFLEKYLPPQLSEAQVSELAEKMIAEHGFKTTDFGKAMGVLKTQVGAGADGSLLAKVLKEKLK